jgi:hypothetical protein
VRQRGPGACGTVDCCHEREGQTHVWEAPPGGTHRPVYQGDRRRQLTTERAPPGPADAGLVFACTVPPGYPRGFTGQRGGEQSELQLGTRLWTLPVSSCDGSTGSRRVLLSREGGRLSGGPHRDGRQPTSTQATGSKSSPSAIPSCDARAPRPDACARPECLRAFRAVLRMVLKSKRHVEAAHAAPA